MTQTATEQTPREHVFLWGPSREQVEKSRMYDFARWAEKKHSIKVPDYVSLHRWSVDNLEEFWQDIWDYFGVVATQTAEEVLTTREMPGARWFPGARLNYAENSLRTAKTSPDEVAVIGDHETAESIELTWGELEAQVASLAHKLRDLGVKPGDRVAAVLPNIPQTVVALMATAAVGAVWSVVNTDFGPTGVADRFAQIAPKVLFTVDGYDYAGKMRDMTGTVDQLREVLPTVEQFIVVDQCNPEDVGNIAEDALRFSQITQVSAEPRYEQVPFEHPLWILYSSGTTGKPKGIVHSHGGVILEFLKAIGLHADVHPGDRAYIAVATTWMMWNLHMGNLMMGATILTYDGSPGHNGPDKSLELVARHGITFFGTGAGVLTMAHRGGTYPKIRYDFSALRGILVTGSPLPDPTWEWVYEAISADVRLGSDSGGTDVTSAFVGSNPFMDVYRGEIMGSYLGVDAQSWSPEGKRIWNQVGELVLTTPMPSMPLYFWNDEDGTRYKDAYFHLFPGTWRQGDWTTQFEDGRMIIHGRSDSTINRGGIRMGSADITDVVDQVDGVEASMVIGAELAGGDYYMPLFVVPRPGKRITDDLKQRVIQAIRSQLSPRYVPDAIIEAPAVPRTRTGKLLEIPVKKLYQGAETTNLNRASAEDETVLDWYADNARAFHEGRGK
ncbi:MULTISPECIES: acetoacetate--CoA ligase [Micrococcaceae]|uniref:acetoacetate--CoA ligase n=1 Tax=unclassified Kocuria TaxID=2649579 RepID=UPI00101039A7|nr:MULTISPECIES: acetoacetate--CoA ligase [unclassified Kocuria]